MNQLIRKAASTRRESKAARQRRLQSERASATKKLICLRLDHDVLDWFRERGPGYQTRINTVLRAFRDASL